MNLNYVFFMMRYFMFNKVNIIFYKPSDVYFQIQCATQLRVQSFYVFLSRIAHFGNSFDSKPGATLL